MKKLVSNAFGNVLSILGVVLTQEQLESVEKITAIICMVLGLLITIISSIIIPLVKWWRKAKKDGKITKEEIKEGMDIISDGFNDLEDKLKKEDKHNDIQGKD